MRTQYPHLISYTALISIIVVLLMLGVNFNSIFRNEDTRVFADPNDLDGDMISNDDENATAYCHYNMSIGYQGNSATTGVVSQTSFSVSLRSYDSPDYEYELQAYFSYNAEASQILFTIRNATGSTVHQYDLPLSYSVTGYQDIYASGTPVTLLCAENYTLDINITSGGDICLDFIVFQARTNFWDADTDDDGINDNDEVVAPFTSPVNPDTDQDGLPDGLEKGVPSPGVLDGSDPENGNGNPYDNNVNGTYNGTGTPFIADQNAGTLTDPQDADSDGDGISDGEEDTDANGAVGSTETDPFDLDTDDDGLADGDSILVDSVSYKGEDQYDTCPWDADSDDDGLPDGLEVGISLENGIPDSSGGVPGTATGGESPYIADTNTSSTTNPTNLDTDGDGLPDGWVDGWFYNSTSKAWYALKDNGLNQDYDGNVQDFEGEDLDLDGNIDSGNWGSGGEVDPNKVDTDGDKLTDGAEIKVYSSDPLNPSADADGDGLSDDYEALVSETNLTNSDTDGDGLLDGWDDVNGDRLFDPVNETKGELGDPNCNDTNSLSGRYGSGSDPNDADTDDDGLTDYFECVTGWYVTVNGTGNYHVTSNACLANTDNPYDTTHYENDFMDDKAEYENGTDPYKLDTDGDDIKDGCESVIFRTNAVDSNSDGIFEYNQTGVWIAVSHSGTSPDLDFYQYSTATTTWMYDGTYLVMNSPDGYRLYKSDQNLYILYENNGEPLDGGTSYNVHTFTDDTPGDFSYIERANISGYAGKVVLLNATNGDTDGDGLSDGEERYQIFGSNLAGSSPVLSDTDYDGISDYVEVKRSWGSGAVTSLPTTNDSDVDGVNDGAELKVGYRCADSFGSLIASPWIALRNETDILQGYGYYQTWGQVNLTGCEELGFTTVEGYSIYRYNSSNGTDIIITQDTNTYLVFSSNATDFPDINNANLSTYPTMTYALGEVMDMSISMDPSDNDTDDDALIDGDEDLNGDGDVDTNETDPLDSDTDDDALLDGWEELYSSFNGSTVLNPLDDDTDDNNVTDGFEDHDNDSLLNFEEQLNGTSPLNSDSDYDTLPDGWEVYYGIDPLDNGSGEEINGPDGDFDDEYREGWYHGDDLNNSLEYIAGSDPTKIDTDGDGIDDFDEVNWTGEGPGTLSYVAFNGTNGDVADLNPALADTDNDGLWDGDTIRDDDNKVLHLGEQDTAYSNADPLDNDTDDDGLFDGWSPGGEYGVMKYKTTYRVNITENTSVDVNITPTRDKTYGPSDFSLYTVKVEIELFLIHDDPTELNITLAYQTYSPDYNEDLMFIFDGSTYNNSEGSTSLYLSCVPHDAFNQIDNISLGYTAYSWRLYVNDTVNNSNKGYVERFSVTEYKRTNPNSSDTDGDGLSDFEEVNYGDYGFITDPLTPFTDSDNWTDLQEVCGNGFQNMLGLPSHPALSDTDGDGFWDSDDLFPSSNGAIKIQFTGAWLSSEVQEDEIELYPVLTVNGENFTFAPWSEDGMFQIEKGTWQNLTEPGIILVDIEDDMFGKSVTLRAFDRDSGEDDEVDLLPGEGESYTTELRSLVNMSSVGSESDTHAKFWMDNSYTNISKIKSLLVLSNNGIMNINTTAGQVRFTADDEKFVLIVANVTDENSSSIFDKGPNTIIVPSAVFFASKFFNEMNGTNQSANLSLFLDGNTTFLHPNATNSPADVLFYICTNQSSAKTERLMRYLLQNVTGNKTSWYANVTDYLYLCNLPVALVRTIPLACSENFSLWEGPGEDPDEQWWEKGSVGEAVKVAKDCMERVIDGCIWVVSGQFLVDIGTAIWEWGCGASKAVSDKLSEIKEAVVEALNIIKAWALEKITNAAQKIFSNLDESQAEEVELSNTLSIMNSKFFGESIKSIPGAMFAASMTAFHIISFDDCALAFTKGAEKSGYEIGELVLGAIELISIAMIIGTYITLGTSAYLALSPSPNAPASHAMLLIGLILLAFDLVLLAQLWIKYHD